MCKGTGVLDVTTPRRQIYKVLLPNRHVKLSLMMAVMDVDLLLGIEQALMLHSVSISCSMRAVLVISDTSI